MCLPLVRGEPLGSRKAAREMIRRQFDEIGEFAQHRPLVDPLRHIVHRTAQAPWCEGLGGWAGRSEPCMTGIGGILKHEAGDRAEGVEAEGGHIVGARPERCPPARGALALSTVLYWAVGA